MSDKAATSDVALEIACVVILNQSLGLSGRGGALSAW